MTTTSQPVGSGYSGTRLAVHRLNGVDGWASHGRGGCASDAARYGGVVLAADETPAEFGELDSQGEWYAVGGVASVPRRALAVERFENAPVRSRTLVVDGYVRSAPPGVWSASHAAIDRGLIGRWAARCGWRIGRVFEEPTAAGLTDRRSLLLEAVERAESRESDGLVVARLKNLGSSLEEAVAVLERIQAAGGAFGSVCEGIDLAGSDGRMLLRVLVSMLEW